jgi:hypothetical protein
MKNTTTIVFVIAFMLILMGLSPAAAAEFYTIEKYAETIIPGENNDGVLSVQLTATPGSDGYVYVVKSVSKMTFRDIKETKNTAGGSTLEACKLGDLEYFRIKAADPSAAVSLTANFDCPAFYGAKQKADLTGIPATPVNCKFTNPFAAAIGSYSIRVKIPKGREIISVSTPKAYADFVLENEDGSRGISLSKKKLAPSAVVTLAFSFGETLNNNIPGLIILWIVCLGIGAAVFIARFPREKTA